MCLAYLPIILSGLYFGLRHAFNSIKIFEFQDTSYHTLVKAFKQCKHLQNIPEGGFSWG
jgi:hypothetical protein